MSLRNQNTISYFDFLQSAEFVDFAFRAGSDSRIFSVEVLLELGQGRGAPVNILETTPEATIIIPSSTLVSTAVAPSICATIPVSVRLVPTNINEDHSEFR